MSQQEQLAWKSKFRWNGRDGLGRVLLWNGTYQTKNTMKIKSALSFTRLRDGDVGGFATGVHDGVVKNATLFLNPTITPAVLLGGITTYTSALGAANKGSVAQTLAKNIARAALEDMLRTLASYVDGIAKGDPTIIMLAGFVPTGMSATPAVVDIALDKPVITSTRNGLSGQLLVRVKPSDQAYAYEGQVQIKDGSWQTMGISTQAREIQLNNLTPGTFYNVRVRVIGANKTYSDWSNLSGYMAN
jgi:hypothetical protein